jgi:hypothetical protein
MVLVLKGKKKKASRALAFKNVFPFKISIKRNARKFPSTKRNGKRQLDDDDEEAAHLRARPGLTG